MRKDHLKGIHTVGSISAHGCHPTNTSKTDYFSEISKQRCKGTERELSPQANRLVITS